MIRATTQIDNQPGGTRPKAPQGRRPWWRQRPRRPTPVAQRRAQNPRTHTSRPPRSREPTGDVTPSTTATLRPNSSIAQQANGRSARRSRQTADRANGAERILDGSMAVFGREAVEDPSDGSRSPPRHAFPRWINTCRASIPWTTRLAHGLDARASSHRDDDAAARGRSAAEGASGRGRQAAGSADAGGRPRCGCGATHSSASTVTNATPRHLLVPTLRRRRPSVSWRRPRLAGDQDRRARAAHSLRGASRIEADRPSHDSRGDDHPERRREGPGARPEHIRRDRHKPAETVQSGGQPSRGSP